MAAPQSSPLPEAPTRGEAEGQFVPKANAFVGALEPFRQQLQRQADYVNTRTAQLEQAATRAENAESGALDAEATSAANANFAGSWSSLSGSYSVPTSVFHEGYFWALVQNVSSIGDHEPGASSAWVIIQRAFRELSVEPTLSSNFRTGEHKLYGVQDGYKSRELADIWDVTRASGETVLTPAGRIATVDPDTLPLTYVPETGGLGAQVTGAVTNELLWSEDFTQSEWGAPSGAEVLDTFFLGDYLVQRVLLPGGTANARFQIPVSMSVGTTYSATIMARAVSGPKQARISSGAGLSVSQVIFELTEDFKEYTLVAQAESTSASIQIIRRATTDPADMVVDVVAARFTNTSSPAPYIKTEASTVTKPATNVVRELGEEFNPSEFTIFCKIRRTESETLLNPVKVGPRPDASFTGIGIQKREDARYRVELRVDGEPSQSLSDNTEDDIMRWAFGIHGGSFFSCCNGVYSDSEISSGNSVIVDFLHALYLGSGLRLSGSGDLVGQEPNILEEVRMISRAFPQAELIEQTRG